jgi:hypothetical protein
MRRRILTPQKLKPNKKPKGCPWLQRALLENIQRQYSGGELLGLLFFSRSTAQSGIHLQQKQYETT